MKTRKFISLLLLIAATIVNGAFAQSAEEATKYGQLKEVQLPAAGKLGKFIKKADSNITALKISGELNEKDWLILFSLPNIAYLDLGEATNLAQKGYVGNYNLSYVNRCPILETLQYLVVPENSTEFVFPYQKENHKYNFEKLIVGCNFQITPAVSDIVTFKSLKIIAKEKCLSLGKSQLSKAVVESRGEYIIDYEGEPEYNRHHCDTLFIPNTSALNWKIIKNLDPNIVMIESTGKMIINHDRYSSIISMLPNTEFADGAFFNNKNLKQIVLDNNVTEIPDGCFWGCSQLENVNISNVKSIGFGCFWGCSQLENIDISNVKSIGEYAFSFSGVESIKWPAEAEEFSITSIEASKIKQVDLTNHQYPPIIKGEITDIIKNNVDFIIPKGARKHYQKGEWQKLNYFEDGAKETYTFQIDSVGSLKNFITDDICLNIKSLTIKGIVDETDFDIIKKCQNLQYLDLQECFTFESMEKSRERYLNAKMELEAMMAKAEQQYQSQTLSAAEANLVQSYLSQLSNEFSESMPFENLYKAVESGKVVFRDYCYFPQNALAGLNRLETLILPNKSIIVTKLFDAFNHPQKLKKVQFSNETKIISDYAFSGCTNLEEINIPDSLFVLGPGCFMNCAIHKVDLRNSKILYWTLDDRRFVKLPGVESLGLTLNAFFDCPLIEFYTPKNIVKLEGAEWLEDKKIEKLYVREENWSKRWQTNNPNEVVLYFNFDEPFCEAKHIENIYGKIKELHVPRGKKAAWRGYPNVIDDIDL